MSMCVHTRRPEMHTGYPAPPSSVNHDDGPVLITLESRETCATRWMTHGGAGLTAGSQAQEPHGTPWHLHGLSLMCESIATESKFMAIAKVWGTLVGADAN